jgi:hypothetical protein
MRAATTAPTAEEPVADGVVMFEHPHDGVARLVGNCRP